MKTDMNTHTVSPRILKGFRDIHPPQQIVRERCIETLQRVFQLFGFVPIDTPILEYQDVLLGEKHARADTASASEIEKQVYAFEDKGGRAVAMRFDLTVPCARYAAMNQFSMPKPFHRYQIGKVFRGENAQRGRYREFIQCDFDIIGLANEYTDSSILTVIDHALAALKLIILHNMTHDFPYEIHVSHRGILNALLAREKCDMHIMPVLRIMDKIRKVPQEQIVQDLCAYMPEKTAEYLIHMCECEESNERTLAKLRDVLTQSAAYEELATIERIMRDVHTTARIVIDPSIMRGLQYYTGFVCETFISDIMNIGSICSGGRYDNLTQRFSKTPLQGVGASIGLDRLLAACEEITTRDEEVHATCCVLLYGQTEQCLENAFTFIKAFHTKGISAQVFPSTQGLKYAFKHAEKIGVEFLVIIGEEEYATKTLTVKNLHTREQHQQQPLQEILQWIQQQRKTR